MSGIATAIIGTAVVSGVLAKGAADTAAKATRGAASTQAEAQTAQLEYLKEREAIPQAYREQAIQQLGTITGLPGIGEPTTTTGRQDFVEGLREDPFYQEMVTTGEEAVLRGASATGGLRSGATSESLAKQNQAILRDLYSQRVGELQGLAGLPSNVIQIGETISDIGTTQAQGQVAAAQIKQQGLQSAVNLGLSGINTALGVI